MNWRALPFFLSIVCCASAESRYFVGGGTGLAILSADASSSIDEGSSALSRYAPRKGPIVHAFAGVHAGGYISVQGEWSWNRNTLTLSGAEFRGGESAWEQSRSSSQHNVGADGLLYFRDRRSWVRPYLSVGINWMRFRSEEKQILVRRNAPSIPPRSLLANEPGLRVAAGIDVMHPSGWGFRYAFIENIQRNPIGRLLAPAGSASLMNFQNQFAVIRYFGGD
jgi:hypothetical protein